MQQEQKCVIVVDGALPAGLVANTAAILGVTLGKLLPETVGPDVTDGDGGRHPGIIKVPVPILKGDRALLRSLHDKLQGPDYDGLTVVDFSDVAQGCMHYDDYTGKLAATPEASLQYYGLALYGGKKAVARLTGSLPLLR